MAAQALVTALGEMRSCPSDLVEKTRKNRQGCGRGHPGEVPDGSHREDKTLFSRKIEEKKGLFLSALHGETSIGQQEVSEGIAFIRGLSDCWRAILSSFQEMIDSIPLSVQEVFSEILAVQILALEKQEIKELLIQGICRSW